MSQRAVVAALILVAAAGMRAAPLPLVFELNTGQAPNAVRYLARGSGFRLFLTAGQSVLSTRSGPTVSMRLAGTASGLAIEGADRLSGYSNYFIGNDPGAWRTNIPNYARVRSRGVYPGIDLVYYGNGGALEYDFVVAPGADPNRIRMRFDGASKPVLDANGDLILVPGIRQNRPVVYQEVQGERREVEGAFRLTRGGEVGFHIGAYDAGLPLVIDPVLLFSTYLGGEDFDGADAVAVDPDGNVYVAGTTTGLLFPTSNSFQAGLAGIGDFFITKLSADGSTRIYSTYLGGPDCFVGRASIGLGADRSVYVAGWITGDTFPRVGGVQLASGGGQDGVVARINPAGNGLIYSTYLGGTGIDVANAIAVDQAGNAYVTGFTYSSGFPQANPFQPIFHGSSDSGDAYVSKINPSGTVLVYSTFLGGRNDDLGYGIAVDSAGNAVVVGTTASPDFPLQTPLDSSLGDTDGFVTRLNAAGNGLIYSTFLGGADFEEAYAVAVDSQSNAYVTGVTDSNDFPKMTPFQQTYGGGDDAFLTKINPTGTALIYSTYFGGKSQERGFGIALDAGGGAVIAGTTASDDFFQMNPLQAAPGGDGDAFVTQFDPNGSAVRFSTRLGGRQYDSAGSVALAANGNIYIAGLAQSGDFPMMSAIQPHSGGGESDAFVAAIAPTTPSIAALVNSASYAVGDLAPDSFVDAYGQNLAGEFVQDSTLPTKIAGVTVTVTDSAGVDRLGRLNFVSAGRIQLLMPSGLASGAGKLRADGPNGSVSVPITIAQVRPGIFSANASGQGPAAGTYLHVDAAGARTDGFTFTLDAVRLNDPIGLGPDTDQVYLSFYGTGFRNQASVSCSIGGTNVPVLGAVAQGVFPGLDQAVVGPVPRSLAGRANAEVVFTFDGKAANTVTVSFR